MSSTAEGLRASRETSEHVHTIFVNAAWEDLTPLARNEWICWTISVKQPATRRQHVERVRTELKEGMRRPCCWYGCIHRTDKAISPSVQYVLNKRSKKSS